MSKLQHLLNKVNKVTSCYRHGREISNCVMDALCNAQSEFGQGGEWISVDDELPYERCLAYTPTDNLIIKYRIIPAGMFTRIATEATFWKSLQPPNSEVEDE